MRETPRMLHYVSDDLPVVYVLCLYTREMIDALELSGIPVLCEDFVFQGVRYLEVSCWEVLLQ